MKIILLISLCFALNSCGFQLRGQAPLLFETLYISPSGHPLAIDLRHYIERGGSTVITSSAQDAEATVEIISAINSQLILSISGTGRVREFQLIYRVSYRLVDTKGLELKPLQEVLITRIMPFLDAQVIAKGEESQVLARDMRVDAVQQIVRQLSKIKPPTVVTP